MDTLTIIDNDGDNYIYMKYILSNITTLTVKSGNKISSDDIPNTVKKLIIEPDQAVEAQLMRRTDLDIVLR